MPWWLPILIFIAETCVVTFGTLRTIFVARGMKRVAPFVGLMESSIWLFAIGQVVSNLSHIPCSLAYALGYTCGNYLGISIEEMLAIGTQVVRITTNKNPKQLIERLDKSDFGVTSVEAAGSTGPVNVIFTIVKRKQLTEVVEILRQHDPHLFYTIEDVRAVERGIFRKRRDEPAKPKLPYRLQLRRKRVRLQASAPRAQTTPKN
jgi:uncharacterized protein YebE (UPF0316 family)